MTGEFDALQAGVFQRVVKKKSTTRQRPEGGQGPENSANFDPHACWPLRNLGKGQEGHHTEGRPA